MRWASVGCSMEWWQVAQTGKAVGEEGAGGSVGRGCQRVALWRWFVFLFMYTDLSLPWNASKVCCSSSGPQARAAAPVPPTLADASSDAHVDAFAARHGHRHGRGARVQEGRRLPGAAVAPAVEQDNKNTQLDGATEPLPEFFSPPPLSLSLLSPVGITRGSGHAHQAIPVTWQEMMCATWSSTQTECNCILTQFFIYSNYATSSKNCFSPSPSRAAGVLGAARRALGATRPSARPCHCCTL